MDDTTTDARSEANRRTVLRALAGGVATLGGLGASAGTTAAEPVESVKQIHTPSGNTTKLYTLAGDGSGETVLLTAGVQGGEPAGIRAAERLTSANVAAGTLAIIPRANKYALERGSYSGKQGNLNRHFPPNEPPESKLARTLWNAVQTVDPDTMIDLHSSKGVYDRSPEGVGQAVFRSHSNRAAKRASEAAAETNEAFGLSSGREFLVRPMSYDSSGPSGLLTEKVALDLGADAYLAEAYRGIPLSRRTDMLTRFAKELLRRAGTL